MRGFTEKYGAKFINIPFTGPEISSSEIRERVAAGESVSGMVPPEVEAYIRERELYLCGMDHETILETLRAELKPGRYTHTLGVAETARHLAPRFGIAPERAYLAGLLHDCAKYMAPEKARKLIRENIADADKSELETEALLHAPAGSVVARNLYGVRDPQILSAIRKHTLGDGHMTPLEALIYIADFIEPNREDFPGLSEVRALAEKDIYAAARLSVELTRKHVKKRGGKLHPRTLEILNTKEEKQ